MRLVLAVAVLWATLDLGSKVAVMRSLVEGQAIPVVDGLLTLHYVRNPGAAYGILLGQRWLLAILAAGICVGILWYARQVTAVRERIALGMLLGGAVGNMHNRLVWGAVTDMIEINPLTAVFRVFNVADIAITFGVLLLAWSMVRGPRPQGEG